MPDSDPMAHLIANMKDIDRLLELHREKAGAKPGRKYGMEVLNKSAIVLLTACWEAFIEDLAEAAFVCMISHAAKPDVFPADVLTLASRPLRDHQDKREVWKLAGDGWKAVLKDHRAAVISQYCGKLNTPKPKQVDSLFSSLIGITSVVQQWSWQKMTTASAAATLESLVEIRGGIAHRVSASQAVTKADVIYYRKFVYRIAVITANRVLAYVYAKTKQKPWSHYTYGGTS